VLRSQHPKERTAIDSLNFSTIQNFSLKLLLPAIASSLFKIIIPKSCQIEASRYELELVLRKRGLFLVPVKAFPHAALHGDDRGLFEPLIRGEDFATANIGQNLQVEDFLDTGDEFEDAEQASALGFDGSNVGDKPATRSPLSSIGRPCGPRFSRSFDRPMKRMPPKPASPQ
jgi:hypothetical protein